MPRFDDPNVKIKKFTKFQRKPLRPWSSIEDLTPQREKNNNETLSKQLANESITDNKQTETISKQENSENVTISKPISKHITLNNSKQLGNQLVNKKSGESDVLGGVKRFSGLQRKLLFYIVENCKSRGLLYTTPITNEFLRILLNTDADSVKTTIQRLIKKGFASKEQGKRGKGGYTIFIITEAVRNAVIEIQKLSPILCPFP